LKFLIIGFPLADFEKTFSATGQKIFIFEKANQEAIRGGFCFKKNF
jgi:hypothetical protein